MGINELTEEELYGKERIKAAKMKKEKEEAKKLKFIEA